MATENLVDLRNVVNFKGFAIGIHERQVDEFLDKLELLCEKYALTDDDWFFRFKVEG